MKLEPIRDWVLGFAMVHRDADRKIELPNAKGVTRCYLIETVGAEAAAAGYAPGDIVVALKVYDQFFYGGSYHRVTFQIGEVIQRVHDVSLEEFNSVSNQPILSIAGVTELVARVSRAA